MWEFESNPARWVLRNGEWRASVERVLQPSREWFPSIERTTEPHERYEGPKVTDPIEGRAWCLLKVAERRAPK